MADDTRDTKSTSVDSALGEMKLEEENPPDGTHSTIAVNGKYEEHPAPYGLKRSLSASPIAGKSASQSPLKDERESQTPKSELDEEEETIGGDITVTVEPGKAPKLSRKSTQKVAPRPPPLYNDLPDSTVESLSVFQCIPECLYGSKAMGRSKMSDDDDGPIDCDCSEERIDGKNHACGEDSDCINRATKMECIDGDCPCGRGCQNQRFQRKQYANVSVIKTDKKGFGLRANVDIHANDFIFEYIGEVINEPTFRKRTVQYDQEGIKHFYFMSLNKSEFIDATKKGNLGRFCNHSCNPNCYVDKWVVGQKLRMGIFAERDVKAGEELVFNYNVDRYGADPQPCYCGELNCSGYIGGKTQSGRATQLSHGTIEALGIDDGDGWDSAVSKKPRKKKANEDDEEYVNNVQPKGLDEEGVRKVMAALLQCKEKWIAVKLLDRIQRCDDDRIRLKVIQFHGYQILRTTLSQWKEDDNIILQVLDILYKFPRMSRNKIIDTKIEAPIQALVDREHEDVAFEAKRLLEEWSKLKVEYRIPRRKYDPNAATGFERRETERVEEVSKSPATPSVTAPTGPKKNIPQRNGPFPPPRPIFRRPPTNVLPAGWFLAKDEKGNQYYYSKGGQTTWVRPTLPAAAPPPPPKAPLENKNKALQDIINNILTEKPSQVATPTTSTPPVPAAQIPKKKPVEKWRSYSIEKQMKLYENTLFPHIKYVVQKFQNKLPKDDLKKFAKEVSKKLVASDYKNNRVEDPTKITDKQEKKVRAFTKDFFDKAVVKRKSIDRQKRERDARKAAAAANGHALKPDPAEKNDDDLAPKTEIKEERDAEQEISPEPEDEAEVMTFTPLSPIEVTPSIYFDPSDLKRKREPGEDTPEDDSESSKRRKEDETDLSPPPPPPPPPAGSMMPEDEMGEEPEGDEVDDHDHSHSHGESMGDLGQVVMRETKEEKEMREQEEELMRENEEAIMMDLDGKLGSVDDGLYLHKTDHINGHSNGNGNGIKAEPESTEVKMKEEVTAT